VIEIGEPPGCFCVFSDWQGDSHGQHVLGIEAPMQIQHAIKGFGHESRANKQD
jgi:hypothetical protein